jgi:hypothetical protein
MYGPIMKKGQSFLLLRVKGARYVVLLAEDGI